MEEGMRRRGGKRKAIRTLGWHNSFYPQSPTFKWSLEEFGVSFTERIYKSLSGLSKGVVKNDYNSTQPRINHVQNEMYIVSVFMVHIRKSKRSWNHRAAEYNTLDMDTRHEVHPNFVEILESGVTNVPTETP